MSLTKKNLLGPASLAIAISAVLGACGDDGASFGETSSSTGSESSGPATTTSSTSASSSTTIGPTSTGSSTSGETTADSTGSDASDTGSTTGSSSGESSSGPGTSTGTTGTGDCIPLLAEVLVDVEGGADNLQWVKLYNPCNDDISLDGYTVGYGGTTYEQDDMQGNPRNKELSGTILAGECYLVGGPQTSPLNGNPGKYDLGDDFAPGLLTGVGPAGDGVALFDLPPEMVDETTVPIDAVVYGANNDNDLIDETGLPVATPHVGAPPLNGSIQRTSTDSTWVTSAVPTPNACPAL